MNKQKGFTLVELLIVIAIIGILAGIILAVINPQRQRQRANEAVGRSALSKACLAVVACVNSSVTSTCNGFASELQVPTGFTITSSGGVNAGQADTLTITGGSMGTCTFGCSLQTGIITAGATCTSN